MTGANFVSAESGRIVVVTNEGNSRFGLAGAKVHIAVVGIEKLVPRDEDLALYLNLLARSSTGQHFTIYTEFIAGPRPENQPEGPENMHVLFIDNGRSETLASDCRDALNCIRCGACLNVCPVFRQASGHAYRHTYPGPIGAVLAPNLVGKEGFAELADLPKASSLCGRMQRGLSGRHPHTGSSATFTQPRQRGGRARFQNRLPPYGRLGHPREQAHRLETGPERGSFYECDSARHDPRSRPEDMAGRPHPAGLEGRIFPPVAAEPVAEMKPHPQKPTEREKVFSNLRKALQGVEKVSRPEIDFSQVVAENRLREDDLWQCFAKNFQGVRGKYVDFHPRPGLLHPG